MRLGNIGRQFVGKAPIVDPNAQTQILADAARQSGDQVAAALQVLAQGQAQQAQMNAQFMQLIARLSQPAPSEAPSETKTD